MQLIGPAIKTLEKLQGAWETMAGDLTGLHDFFQTVDEHAEFRVAITKLEMDSIAARWDELSNTGTVIIYSPQGMVYTDHLLPQPTTIAKSLILASRQKRCHS